MKYIDEVDIANKRVILRCDFNVPVKDGKILDNTRIKKSLKTIEYLLSKNCSLILLSHMGRVKTRDDKEKNTLFPVAKELESLLNKKVKFLDCTGVKTITECLNMQDNEIVLLENTRFCDVPEKLESKNDINLANFWASLGEIFVVDAFASLHRSHSSVAGISKYLPTYFGLLVKEEIKGLDPVISNISHPFGVFMGGGKVDDKIKYIKDILPKCDFLLLGGGIANSFLYADGYDVGESLCTSDASILDEIRDLLKEYKDKIIMPVDFVFDGKKIFDLNTKSISKYAKYLNKCKTIFVNGTPGKFEDEQFSHGTVGLFEALKEIDAIKIAGGGDTLNAINQFSFDKVFTYLSSGGGASLEYVSTHHLEAIDYILSK